VEHLNNLFKNWPRPVFGLRTNPTCHQKPIPSHETVPLNSRILKISEGDFCCQGMMAVDAAGMVMGWRFFDHAAHLSGILFGILWCHLGQYGISGQNK
jgi:hypothetical protein